MDTECPVCGATMDDAEDAYCTECGTDLSDYEEE